MSQVQARRPLAGLASAGYTAGTLGALLLSLSVGLFGFRESISASYVTQSLAIETITLLALLSWTALAAATPGHQPAPPDIAQPAIPPIGAAGERAPVRQAQSREEREHDTTSRSRLR